jgi:hypothetical protein
MNHTQQNADRLTLPSHDPSRPQFARLGLVPRYGARTSLGPDAKQDHLTSAPFDFREVPVFSWPLGRIVTDMGYGSLADLVKALR